MAHAQTASDVAAALRRECAQLPAAAHQVAALLESYAVRLCQPEKAAAALTEFAAFANHHKGLRDIIVPGVSAQQWSTTVERLRAASNTALRWQGLDRSLMGRLQGLFTSYRRRNEQPRP